MVGAKEDWWSAKGWKSNSLRLVRLSKAPNSGVRIW